MARYIDADKIIEDIKRVYCADCNNYNEILCRSCGTADAMSMIDDAPAADVVPTSEVEELKGQLGLFVKDSAERDAEKYTAAGRLILETRRNVAREIFAKVKTLIFLPRFGDLCDPFRLGRYIELLEKQYVVTEKDVGSKTDEALRKEGLENDG